MLGFVVFHGDFEHVVAADADAMDFGLGFAVGGGRVGGVGILGLRFGRVRILAWPLAS